VRHGVPEHRGGHHVHLHLHPAEIEIGLHVGEDVPHGFLLGVCGGRNHLDVEGNVVVQVHRVELRHVAHIVQEAARRERLGGEPRREGLSLLASRGKGAGQRSEGHMLRHRPEAGCIFPAAVVGDAAVIIMGPAGDAIGHCHRLCASGTEEGHLLARHRQKRRGVLEIRIHGLFHVRKRDLFFIVNQFLDHHQGIGDVGQSNQRRSGTVVHGAALGDVSAFDDASVDKR